MPLVQLIKSTLISAPVATQQRFLENYIACRIDDTDITPDQLKDPTQWALIAPDLIDTWEENTRESIKHGHCTIEDLSDEVEALSGEVEAIVALDSHPLKPKVETFGYLLAAAPPATQKGFLENYLDVALYAGEVTQAQLDDPAQWALIVPGLIHGWVQNTLYDLVSGDYNAADYNTDLMELSTDS